MLDEQQADIIRDALELMDHENADHWTPDGLPKTGIVRRILVNQTITRDQIAEAWPDFRRVKPATESEPDFSEPAHTVSEESAVTRGSDGGGNPLPAVETPVRSKPSQSDVATAIRDAGDQLQAARVAVVECQNSQKRARANLAEKVQAWQLGQPRITPEQLARQTLEANQRERAEAAARGEPVGAAAKRFVQKQMKRGRRRGMFVNGQFVEARPPNMQGAFIGQVKPPSER